MNQTSPSAHTPSCTCGSPTEHHYSCPLYSYTSKPKIKENNVGWDTNPTSIHRVSQNKKEGWEEEFDKKSNEDTFGQMSADTAKDIFRHILHEREEEVKENIRWSWDIDRDTKYWCVQIWYGSILIDSISPKSDECGMVKLKDTALDEVINIIKKR